MSDIKILPSGNTISPTRYVLCKNNIVLRRCKSRQTAEKWYAIFTKGT